MDLASAFLMTMKLHGTKTRTARHFGNQQIVSTSAAGANSVFAADLDGDGDMDLASASIGDNKIAWYENTDGKALLEVNRSCRRVRMVLNCLRLTWMETWTWQVLFS